MTDATRSPELYKSAKESREQMHNTSEYEESFPKKQAYEAMVQGFAEVITTFSEPYDHSDSDEFFSDKEIYDALLEAFKREDCMAQETTDFDLQCQRSLPWASSKQTV